MEASSAYQNRHPSFVYTLHASKCCETGMCARSLVDYMFSWPSPRPLGRRHKAHKRASNPCGGPGSSREGSGRPQTPAISMCKRHRPTKIVIRASSAHFTQASAAKMGCARPRSAQNGHKKPKSRHKVGIEVCMHVRASPSGPPVWAPFGAEGRCALRYD